MTPQEIEQIVKGVVDALRPDVQRAVVSEFNERLHRILNIEDGTLYTRIDRQVREYIAKVVDRDVQVRVTLK